MALTLMPPNLGCSPARKPRNNYKLNFESLFFGKRADATDWHMPKQSLDGIKAYKAALQAEKGLKPTGTNEAEQSSSNGRCPTAGGGDHYGPAGAVDDDLQVAGIDPL